MLLWLLYAASAACPDLDARLDRVESDVKLVHTRAAEDSLLLAEAALGCGSPASPAQLGRFWVLEGVLATVTRDETRAHDAFSAAARVDPGGYVDQWGPGIREAFDAAAAEADGGTGEILLVPEIGGNIALLDGGPAPDLNTAPAGVHAIQITDLQNEVLYGRMIYLAPDQRLVLETGIQTAPYVIDVVESGADRVKQPGLLVLSGASLAAAGGLAWAADRQNGAMRDATSVKGVDNAFAGQVAFATGSVTAIGTSALFGILWATRQR
ncbi:MAG: hypothetical protein H6737_30450 [Alphaproteobacteria bacterium]|nr:hypothetical protein [Alphaproteobacteria bacterium]